MSTDESDQSTDLDFAKIDVLVNHTVTTYPRSKERLKKLVPENGLRRRLWGNSGYCKLALGILRRQSNS